MPRVSGSAGPGFQPVPRVSGSAGPGFQPVPRVSGSAGPEFDPRWGSKFLFENFQAWG